MSKHTPGPGMVDGDDISPETDNTLSICEISPVDVGGGKGWHFGAQTRANQRLIAAAPDLLEALIACREDLAVLLRRHNVRSDEDGSWLYDGQTVSEADSAIAKANGEQA